MHLKLCDSSLFKSLYLLIFLSVSACASIQPVPVEITEKWSDLPELSLNCFDYSATISRHIKQSGYQDNQFALLHNTPQLRIDRFTLSFKDELNSEAKRHAWIKLLYEKARSSQIIEINNVWQNFTAQHHTKLEQCQETELAALLADTNQQRKIIDKAFIKENYQTWQRILGASKLIGPFVNQRVRKWQHIQTQKSEKKIWKNWTQAHLYKPEAINSHSNFSDLLQAARINNPLGIPLLDKKQNTEVLNHYAPMWLLENQSDYNQIGKPTRNISGEIEFNKEIVESYAYVSHTRFYNQILLQLNYVVWFSERPKNSAFDIYGGELDGLVFRITLDKNGQALIYDSIHNCGCFHTAFSLSPILKAVQAKGEPILLFEKHQLQTQRPVVVVDTAEHVVLDVLDSKSLVLKQRQISNQTYRLVSYNELRKNNPLRLFNDAGLVPDTQRLERFLLWPFGITSPGAMRQRGQHPIAFTSKRHFDDARLLERWFRYTQSNNPKQ